MHTWAGKGAWKFFEIVCQLQLHNFIELLENSSEGDKSVLSWFFVESALAGKTHRDHLFHCCRLLSLSSVKKVLTVGHNLKKCSPVGRKLGI